MLKNCVFRPSDDVIIFKSVNSEPNGQSLLYFVVLHLLYFVVMAFDKELVILYGFFNVKNF